MGKTSQVWGLCRGPSGPISLLPRTSPQTHFLSQLLHLADSTDLPVWDSPPSLGHTPTHSSIQLWFTEHLLYARQQGQGLGHRLSETRWTLLQGAFGLSEEADTLMVLATQFCHAYGNTESKSWEMSEPQ